MTWLINSMTGVLVLFCLLATIARCRQHRKLLKALSGLLKAEKEYEDKLTRLEKALK